MNRAASVSSFECGDSGDGQRRLMALWVALMMRVHDVERIAVRVVDGSGDPGERLFVVEMGARDVAADMERHLATSRGVDRSTLDPDVLLIGVDGRKSSIEIAEGRADELDDDELATLHLGDASELTIGVWDESSVPVSASWLTERFLRFVETSADEPDRPLSSYSLLTPDDRAVVATANDTAHAHDDRASLVELFDLSVERVPEAAAVEVDGVVTTYRELDSRARSLAHVLRDHGVSSGDAVVLCSGRSLDLAVGMIGILRTGAAYVPVDPAYPQDRQDYMIRDCGADVVIADSDNAERLGALSGATVIEIGADSGDTDTAEPSNGGPTGSDGGYVIYTSGSTGEPKGVWMPQRALTNLIEWQLRRPQARAGTRTLQFSALSFDVSFQEIFSTWASGGTLVLISDRDRRDAGSLLDSLIENRIERLFLPFVALRALAQTAVRTGRIPLYLREVYTAGEQLQVGNAIRAMFDRLPECVLENQYGPSETHVCTAHTLPLDPASWPTLPSIGGPIANSEVFVLDRWGEPRPVGLPGELFVGGTCVADGYVGKPEMTSERFLATPFEKEWLPRLYRTGDVVTWQPDGELQFVGRRDAQVKLRGFRVEPGEVSSVLSSGPGVAECAAVVRDDIGGRAARLVGYVVPDDADTFRLADVQDFLGARLPDYMVPTHWAVLESLPMTPSGKLDERSLPIPRFDRNVVTAEYVAPHNDAQSQLAEIWSELLGIERVGVNDDFFELGGDSLLAVEMTSAMFDRLGIDVPLSALTGTRTIADLDAVISGGSEVWRSLVALRPTGSAPPLFVVHGGSGNVGSFPLLADALPDSQPVYALQWDGLDGTKGSRSIERMADRYVQEIKSAQPEGPYRLAGQCIGGLVAMEMAGQLKDAGEAVDLVVMYDSPNLRSPAYEARRTPFAVSQLKRLLTAGSDRRRMVRVRIKNLLGRRVEPADREVHGSLAMIRAGWRYTPRADAVATRELFVGSGLSNASDIALAGSWDDGAMGWAHRAGPGFRIAQVEADHNGIPMHPDGVRVLLEELAAVTDEARD